MPRCGSFKADNSPCERIVGASQTYCFAHDPTKEEVRKRNAAKAGASKPNRELSEAKDALRLVADMVLQGSLDSRRAAVAIVNARRRSLCGGSSLCFVKMCCLADVLTCSWEHPLRP
jgi:hypothetical protein